MKSRVLIAFFLTVWVGSPTLLGHAQEEMSAVEVGEAQRTATGFFTALQVGDVRHLRAVLGGKAFQQYKVLLEQNHEYPSFLRQYYSGATMTMEGVRKEDKAAVVTMRMKFPDGVKNTTLLRTQRTLGGTVKIVAIDE